MRARQFLRFQVILCILLRYHYRATISRAMFIAGIVTRTFPRSHPSRRIASGMAERVDDGIRLRVYEYRYSYMPSQMPPRGLLARAYRTRGRRQCLYLLIPRWNSKREREKREMASSHLPSKALRIDMHVPGPSSTIVWWTFRERRRESRACVRIIATAMPIRSVARKFNASSRLFSLALMVAWGRRYKDA